MLLKSRKKFEQGFPNYYVSDWNFNSVITDR